MLVVIFLSGSFLVDMQQPFIKAKGVLEHLVKTLLIALLSFLVYFLRVFAFMVFWGIF